MASPPTASPKTRSRSASSRASTTRSASSSAAPTVYATRNICGSRCSHACFQRSEVAKNTHTTSRRPQLLHSMPLIVGNSRCERRFTGHSNMSEGNKQCMLFVRRDDMAKDATFVTGIRQVRDGAMRVIGVSNIFGLKLFDHLWCQFNLEWHGCL